MKKYYNINYSLLVLLLTPTLLRNDLIWIFLFSLVRPLDDAQKDFIRYDESLQSKINAQICYLQTLINDEFDFYERRIKIRNYEFDFDSLLTWKITTTKRTVVGTRGSGNEYLRNAKGQIGANVPDFEIVFPVGFTLSQDEQRNLRLLVNRNKLATKKYIISHE